MLRTAYVPAVRTPVVCWVCSERTDRMTADEVKSWRKAERARLDAVRESLDAATLELLRQRIDAHLWRSFPGLAAAKLACCWPTRGEYDARRLAQKLRECGAVTALPVVVAPRQPLVFRKWHPGVIPASGPLGIAYPVGSDSVVPTAALVPMLGWDEAGYRLGYRRDPEGLGFLGEPVAGEPGALASPVCYAAEVDPGHFGGEKE
jgi:5,10-methenyltetrahydrofolate synthetase